MSLSGKACMYCDKVINWNSGDSCEHGDLAMSAHKWCCREANDDDD